MNYQAGLKSLKENKKVTAKEWSNLSGVPESTINNVLSGKTENPSADVIFNLVSSLGASFDEVFGSKSPSDDSCYTKTELILVEQIRWKNRVIFSLILIISVLVVFIAGLFTYDFTHDDRGWYQEPEDEEIIAIIEEYLTENA